MRKIDTESKLKMLNLKGMWKCEGELYFNNDEERRDTFDSYKGLKDHCIGKYKYLGSDVLPITDPDNYEFFNPETNQGYLLPGGLWIRKTNHKYYDSKSECEKNTGLKCMQWNPPDKYIKELKRIKSKDLLNIHKWSPLLSSYDTLEDCEETENAECECISPEEYKKALEIYEEKPNKKSIIAKKRKRNNKGRFE